MKAYSPSERIFIEEVMSAARKLREATKSFSIGSLVKAIRKQLGMSQKVLARRAGMPQSTISRIENGQRDLALSTLNKILCALSCDLVISPLLQGSIDQIRQKQARKLAEKRIAYLKGTMSLEEQQPDSRFIEELLIQEEARLLHGSNEKLWEE
jgi:transcriptional regulator with XRE-family HTH domain